MNPCSPSCCCQPHYRRIEECVVITRIYQQGVPQPRPRRSVVIVNPQTCMVLDASQHQVKLQPYTGCPTQLWWLECTQNGNFLIVNVANGKALDIDGGAKSCAPLITYEKHGRANQQWQIDSGDSTIVNPSSNLVVDVDRAVMYAGQGLIAYHKHGKVNQQFCVQLH
ncbi:hypothetical protein MTP99_005753 [Tenebrio molitor]|jgi:hypothetical protein|uniref:uncharacterized protein n=1 Tax=Tenebrio molitor TaxID=7067 RepID=UPI001C3A1FB2|nr:hypothetical protein MTP99_005753 [Tenebrio molitor]CAH1381834.1 unnamed protein product [Tenebrio molitor]